MRDLARTGLPSLSGLITKTHIEGRAFPMRPVLLRNKYCRLEICLKTSKCYYPPFFSSYDVSQVRRSGFEGCNALMSESGHGLSRFLAET